MGYEGHPFFENGQSLMYISKMRRKIEKMSFLSEIIVPEFVAINCLH